LESKPDQAQFVHPFPEDDISFEIYVNMQFRSNLITKGQIQPTPRPSSALCASLCQPIGEKPLVIKAQPVAKLVYPGELFYWWEQEDNLS